MSKRIKTPDPRGFTLAERDSQRFQLALGFGLMAVIAATFILSFTALAWIGEAMGIPQPFHLLVPLFVDGAQLICAGAITVRRTEGRHAIPEWLGLALTLGLSIIGNVYHSMELGDEVLVTWVKIAFATAIPVMVALGIHIFERSLNTGLRTRVLADEPDKVRFDITPVAEFERAQHAPAQQTRAGTARPAAPTRTTRPAAPTAPARTAHAPEEGADRATEAPRTAPRKDDDVDPETAYQEYKRARLERGRRLTGAEIAAMSGYSEGHARKVRNEWEARIEAELAAADGRPDPIEEQVRDTAPENEPDRVSA